MVKLARGIEGIPLHHELLYTDPCLFGPSVPLNPQPLTGEHLPRVLNDHPELQVRDRAFQVLLKLGTRFGLDPSSRAGLGVVADKSPNFVEEFLFKPL